MNRRELMKTFGSSVAAMAMIPSVNRHEQKHGLLTVDSHRAHKETTGEDLHVWFNGHDVTLSAYEADDIEGVVRLFCRDREQHKDYTASGARHIGGDGWACKLELHGHVVIATGKPL